jgi:hypothetical protein
MTGTNTQDAKTASTLAPLSKLDQGTLVLYTGRKKGVTRGRGDGKLVYGDDKVEVLVWVGFSYEAYQERSLKKLIELEDAGDLITTLMHETREAGCAGVTVHDVCAAIQETKEALKRSLDPDSVPPSSRKDSGYVFDPLVVDGTKVPGAKVYAGNGDPEDKRAPKPGTVYIDGVKLGELVLEPAENGHWKTKSKPKTVAKRILRKKLPAGLYVRYALEPDRLEGLLVGADAEKRALLDQVPVNPSAIRSLFKIAP